MRWMCIVLALALFGCSDDGGTSDQGVSDQKIQDGHIAGDGPIADTSKPPVDGPVPTGEGVLPWPDGPVYHDTKPLSCTPGAANMCNGDKTKYCKSGECAFCPTGYVDCDRTGGCECVGACNGTKCI